MDEVANRLDSAPTGRSRSKFLPRKAPEVAIHFAVAAGQQKAQCDRGHLAHDFLFHLWSENIGFATIPGDSTLKFRLPVSKWFSPYSAQVLLLLSLRMVALQTEGKCRSSMDLSLEKSQRDGRETLVPLVVSRPAKRASCSSRHILFEEFRRLKPSLDALSIGFSISRAKGSRKRGRQRKPPYFACCYDVGSLAHVNVVAFYYPLTADWELMEADPDRYRQRVQSAVREEMIHAIQVLTVKKRYERSSKLSSRFLDAETYYDHLLGRIIAELAESKVGEKAILTAAKLYYEDWTINSIEKLNQADRKYHGRDGYLVCELIRQVTQIRFGELMSEEAKGKAWDKHRIFFVGEYETTENLMMAMAATLRQAVPQLIDLSPTLNEALTEIEATIQTIGGITGEILVRSRGCAQ